MGGAGGMPDCQGKGNKPRKGLCKSPGLASALQTSRHLGSRISLQPVFLTQRNKSWFLEESKFDFVFSSSHSGHSRQVWLSHRAPEQGAPLTWKARLDQPCSSASDSERRSPLPKHFPIPTCIKDQGCTTRGY